MRLGPIKSRVPVGSSITVRLDAGSSLEGILVDIDDDCLVIDAEDGEIILEATAIQMVQRRARPTGDSTSSADGSPPQAPPVPVPVPVPAPAPPAITETPPTPPPSPSLLPAPAPPLVFPVALDAALADLRERVEAMSLDVSAPVFEIPDDRYDDAARIRLKSELDGVRNRYQYAFKVREADRVLQCVLLLEAIAEQYDAPEALRIAGRVAWPLGEHDRALDLFADAADALGDSQSCLDLAMAQRMTGERELAPATLASCVGEDAAADDAALLALVALVLLGEGTVEFAGLLRAAAGWRPGEARLSVLHGGLLCAHRGRLTGFPVDQWDAPEIPPAGLEIVAAAVTASERPSEGTPADATRTSLPAVDHRASVAEPARAVPPVHLPANPANPGSLERSAFRATAQWTDHNGPATAVNGHGAKSGRLTPMAIPARLPVTRTGTEDPDVAALAEEIRSCLSRRDIVGAQSSLKRLKALAPGYQITWELEHRVSSIGSVQSPTTPSPAVFTQSSRPSAGRGSAARSGRAGATAYTSGGALSRAEEAVRRGDIKGGLRLLASSVENEGESAQAVRRIANLLGHKQENRDTALEVLNDYRRLFRTRQEQWAWSQARSTVLEHAGRWDDALGELRGMLEETSSPEERGRLVRRITLALLKTFKRDEAKAFLAAELQRDAGQPAIRELLEELEQAIETGAFSKVEAILQLQASESPDLSPLLTFHLERCEYRGVRAERVHTRNFTLDDIKRLDELVAGGGRNQRLGKDFPRERADLNLSAARIMQDLGITDDRFKARLRYFAAAMGDACALEARHGDVIRAYYSEAISVKADWDDLVEVKLRQLVMSFIQNDAQLLEMGKLPTVEDALRRVMAKRHLVTPVLVALLSLRTSKASALRLIGKIWADRATRELFQQALTGHLRLSMSVDDLEGFTKAWLAAAEQDRTRQEAYRQFSVLNKVSALTSVDRHLRALAEISEQITGLASYTDKARLTNCEKVVDRLRQYAAQNVYVERERLFGTVSHMIRDYLDEFEKAPTVLSLKYLHPYLRALEAEITQHFDRYQAGAEPDNLKVELVVDHYLPDGGKVNVQLQISNGPDASPVSNVVLTVLDSDEYIADSSVVPVAESIAAGESKTCQITLVASGRAIEQELMTLVCTISFTPRSGTEKTATVEPKSIRLHTDEEWQEIPNPYSAGLPVQDRAMFKGRERLISELVATVTGSGRGSVIMYGQKRAGKSSVLYHLQQEISLPDVAAHLDLGDLAESLANLGGSRTFADLLYNIADAFSWRLRQLAVTKDLDVDSPPVPDIEQIRLAPQQKFIEYMRYLVEVWMKQAPAFAQSRLVLLLDEFSLLHKWIRMGDLPADFMKGWKALLERGYFRCVLVGNDLMPRFIQEFQNEFQIVREERVSYLDRASAIQLIVDPIKDSDDGSRYRGKAVDRILELTGCSPYYIQLFCHELVGYMNSETVRAPAIGPADVEAVADQLVGNLPRKEFDNLLTPGDAEVTDISDDLVMDVLRATKKDNGTAMYHEADRNAHPEAERVFDDLERREVLTRLSGNRYRIQVGLFSEWLQHRWT